MLIKLLVTAILTLFVSTATNAQNQGCDSLYVHLAGMLKNQVGQQKVTMAHAAFTRVRYVYLSNPNYTIKQFTLGRNVPGEFKTVTNVGPILSKDAIYFITYPTPNISFFFDEFQLLDSNGNTINCPNISLIVKTR